MNIGNPTFVTETFLLCHLVVSKLKFMWTCWWETFPKSSILFFIPVYTRCVCYTQAFHILLFTLFFFIFSRARESKDHSDTTLFLSSYHTAREYLVTMIVLILSFLRGRIFAQFAHCRQPGYSSHIHRIVHCLFHSSQIFGLFIVRSFLLRSVGFFTACLILLSVIALFIVCKFVSILNCSSEF